VPLLREKIAFGTTVLSRNTVQPFSDKQIELVSTFADQALIAIENTRLFEAEQASKRELQESLEYQTANSDVLAVISRSPNELQPVLDAIVQTALSLCPSDRALVMLPQVDGYRVVARAGSTPKQKQTQGLMPVDRGSVFGRVALEGRTIHVEDVRSDPDYTLPVDDRRTVLGVPLLRDGNIAGVILLLRTRSSLSANARSSS
jgi:GAF domain-containing protein